MNKQVICIVCPKGCKVTVSEDNGGYTTTGNACIRGNVYGIQEAIEPKRILTSTVKISGALHHRCPVVSSAPIKKENLFLVLKALEGIELIAPVQMSQVVIANVLGSGIDIITTRNMGKQNDF